MIRAMSSVSTRQSDCISSAHFIARSDGLSFTFPSNASARSRHTYCRQETTKGATSASALADCAHHARLQSSSRQPCLLSAVGLYMLSKCSFSNFKALWLFRVATRKTMPIFDVAGFKSADLTPSSFGQNLHSTDRPISQPLVNSSHCPSFPHVAKSSRASTGQMGERLKGRSVVRSCRGCCGGRSLSLGGVQVCRKGTDTRSVHSFSLGPFGWVTGWVSYVSVNQKVEVRSEHSW
jgi:hypothetical protein